VYVYGLAMYMLYFSMGVSNHVTNRGHQYVSFVEAMFKEKKSL
jgi:hypothetical protein